MSVQYVVQGRRDDLLEEQPAALRAVAEAALVRRVAERHESETHDIEHALADQADLKLGPAQEHPQADSLLNTYFHQHLTLMQQQHLDWRWIGKELEGETLYCYLQVEDVDDTDDLLVQNTLLMDLFYEQQNIVHMEGDGRPTRSHTFIRGSSPHAFVWR